MSPSAKLLSDQVVDALTAMRAPQPSDLYTNTLVVPGAAHLRDSRNCQDYADVSSYAEGTVLVVSDGASNYVDEDGCTAASLNEAGAALVGELARATALAGLRARMAPDAIAEAVALRIHVGLRPLWAMLGRRGQRILGATLLLGIVTDDWTRIWMSGDGAFGVHLPRSTNLEAVRGDSLVITERTGLVTVGRSLHTPQLSRTVTTAARRNFEDVAQAMPLVLSVDGPVLGAWVASDGLADEPTVQRMLQSAPQRSRGALVEALTRPAHSDDLAVAWACDRFSESLTCADIWAQPSDGDEPIGPTNGAGFYDDDLVDLTAEVTDAT